MASVEEWRKIEKYPQHEVSSTGRIRVAISRYKKIIGRILECSKDKQGYLRALEGAPLVHKLVAHTFLGPRPVGYETHHIDGNKLNNFVENLCYLPILEHRKLTRFCRGEKVNTSKLVYGQVYAIRKIYPKLSITKIGVLFDVSPSTICNIVHRRSWTHV